jgi:predicted DNA-binding transcriptional regulator AlpA
MTERLLTAREVAEHLGLSASTVLDRFECGDLPGFRLFGRKGGPVRFRLSESEATLDRWRVNGPGAGGGCTQPHRGPGPHEVLSQTHPTLSEEDNSDAC